MTAMINDYLWDSEFSKLFARCFERYKGGDKDYTKYYNNEDHGFLYSIGYKPREFFDFVEDLAEHGEPAATTAVLIAAVRRDYFMTIQKGELTPCHHAKTSSAVTNGSRGSSPKPVQSYAVSSTPTSCMAAGGIETFSLVTAFILQISCVSSGLPENMTTPSSSMWLPTATTLTTNKAAGS